MGPRVAIQTLGCKVNAYTRNYLRARLDGPDAWKGRGVTALLAVGSGGRVRAQAEMAA